MRELRLSETLVGLQHRSLSPMASLDRSSAATHQAPRRALAIAIAEETPETERRLALVAKINELELRAIDALRAGNNDLAAQAAEAIAAMTADISASERASQGFAEVAAARREIDAQGAGWRNGGLPKLATR